MELEGQGPAHEQVGAWLDDLNRSGLHAGAVVVLREGGSLGPVGSMGRSAVAEMRSQGHPCFGWPVFPNSSQQQGF